MKEIRYFIIRLNGKDYHITTDPNNCLAVHERLIDFGFVHTCTKVNTMTTTYDYVGSFKTTKH